MKEVMTDIVVIGSLNIDLVTKIPRLPQPGETIRAYDLKMIPGGKGANQAAAAAHLGGDVVMVGRVGQDAFGAQLVENLKNFGVDTRYIIRDKEKSTGSATILVTDAGENCIAVVAGANQNVGPEDIQAAEEVLSKAQFLILQFETPLKSVQEAIQVAKRHSVKTILNPSPADIQCLEFIDRIDYLVLNETEASLLSGKTVTDIDTGFAASHRLLSYGVPIVILTLGEKGTLLTTPQETKHIPAYPVKAVDTTAAGDAFTGALAVSLVKGYPLEKALQLANGAGALTVTRLGAQTSLPSLEELTLFMKERSG